LLDDHGARAHVAAAGLQDVGEPRARLSRTLLKALSLQDGAHVRLVAGDRSILLNALAGGVEDDGLDVVRLDGAQRRRLGVEVGDSVTIEPYEGRRAERVCLVALGRIEEADLPVKEIRDALAERPVVVGDTVKVTPTRKTFDAEVNVLGLTVAGVTGSVNDAEGVMLRVAETTPAGIVTVDDGTQLDVRHAEAIAGDGEASGP
jgi:Cell division protein 48 (CDC48), N-terminal domain/Cell division protein 48 (CDC48), domain 2